MTQVPEFFPPLLGIGSYDKGPGGPIYVLQVFLKALGFADPELICNGRYDEATFRSVAVLQFRMQMMRDEPGRGFLAGIFDETTRDSLRRRHHIDFSLVPMTAGSGCIVMGPDGSPQEWPRSIAA